MTKKLITTFLVVFSIFIFAQNNSLKKVVDKITSVKKANVAVSVKGIDFPFDFNNENAEKKLPMQSVFKFHIALAVLDLVDYGKLKLDQKVFISKAELLPDTWSPIREKYPDGNMELPISELIDYTVAMSDNVGCDVLLKLIGGPKVVQDFLNLKGVKNTKIVYNEEEMQKLWKNQYENFTTMKSSTKLLKDFYQGKMISKKSTNFLMKVMYGTSTGINRLKFGLPKNTEIAHKTGTSSTKNGITAATNDMGIVTLKNKKKYAVSVFVSDSKESEQTNEKIISDISKTVFDFLNK